jgi:hypothetical protein
MVPTLVLAPFEVVGLACLEGSERKLQDCATNLLIPATGWLPIHRDCPPCR